MALSFSLFLVLPMICGMVLGDCGTGSYKAYNSVCDCSNRCLGNSHCLSDGNGGTKCQCLPCMYFDADMHQCIYTPGYGEPCTTTCKSNLVCTNGKCGCASGQTYDADKESCQGAAPDTDCVGTSCTGVPNGNYQACGQLCQDGYFITCSNGFKFVMPCANGFYSDNGVRFLNRTVFNPSLNRCEFTSPTCPRPQDNQVIA